MTMTATDPTTAVSQTEAETLIATPEQTAEIKMQAIVDLLPTNPTNTKVEIAGVQGGEGFWVVVVDYVHPIAPWATATRLDGRKVFVHGMRVGSLLLRQTRVEHSSSRPASGCCGLEVGDVLYVPATEVSAEGKHPAAQGWISRKEVAQQLPKLLAGARKASQTLAKVAEQATVDNAARQKAIAEGRGMKRPKGSKSSK